MFTAGRISACTALLYRRVRDVPTSRFRGIGTPFSPWSHNATIRIATRYGAYSKPNNSVKGTVQIKSGVSGRYSFTSVIRLNSEILVETVRRYSKLPHLWSLSKRLARWMESGERSIATERSSKRHMSISWTSGYLRKPWRRCCRTTGLALRWRNCNGHTHWVVAQYKDSSERQERDAEGRALRTGSWRS
jgi:hypothetical protein